MAAAGVLTVVTGLLFVTIPLHAQTESIDIKVEVKDLVTSIRDIVARAKEGSSLVADVGDLEGLQNAVFNLIARLPTQEKCETQTVIKLAAASIGSHEVLGVLLAGSDVEIQSGLIGLSLAFLDCAAQQLDDKLARSSDVGPELFAISISVNTMIDIIKTSDATIRENLSLVEQRSRSRRDAVPFLGRGFEVSSHVVRWRDTTGSHTFHLGPPLFPRGLRHVQRRSPKGTGTLSVSVDSKSGSVNGKVDWTNPKVGVSAGVGAGVAWGPDGGEKSVNANIGWKNPKKTVSTNVGANVALKPDGVEKSVKANVDLTSKDGKVSGSLDGGVTWDQGGPKTKVGFTVTVKI